MISFSFSSGSAVQADFTVSNKGSGSLILVHSLSGQDQFRSQSRETSWRPPQDLFPVFYDTRSLIFTDSQISVQKSSIDSFHLKIPVVFLLIP